MQPHRTRKVWLIALCLSATLAAQAGTLVRFRTVFGDLLVELLDAEKPATVANFLRYAGSGYWTNLFTHRVVPGFVVQAGGYAVSGRNTAGAQFVQVPRFDPVPNEFNVGPRRSNVRGTLAMAKRAGAPDSATTDWFFNLADNSSELDVENGGFTVFGQVLAGWEVLDVFNRFTYSRSLEQQPTNRLYYLGNPGPFNASPNPPSFPVLSGFHEIHEVYTNLVYFEVRVLPLHAEPVGFLPGIRWLGIPGITNHVEVSDTPQGPWRLLTNVVSGGSTETAVDPAPPPAPEFFRVRIGD
ncbi:MAG: peptidylprolyl isomerase [Verrucomicrobiales bacterium]|nr:peptidylprolyl isomerase [Verrucomicrobiales bacterium]